MKPLWKDIIQLNLQDLKQTVLVGEFEDKSLLGYAKAIICYLEEDISGLESIEIMDKNLQFLKNMRLAILNNNFEEKLIEKILNEREVIPKKFKGEYFFLLGIIEQRRGNKEDSKYFYKLGYEFLSEIGSHQKSLKSYMNFIAMNSHCYEDRKAIEDFQFVAKEARKIKDKIVEGLCLFNISIEHYKFGAFDLSLEYVREALSLLENDYGVNHYYSALAHRCHLFIELERYPEALLDFQTLKASQVQSSIESVKVLEVILGQSNLEVNTELLEVTFKRRLEQKQNGFSQKKLTKLDNKLLKILSKGPKRKDELIKSLYGERLDSFSAEARFKILLNRIRKKNNIQIEFQGNSYRIAEKGLDLDLSLNFPA